MIAIRKNIIHALIRLYRNGRIFVPNVLLWLRREVGRADFAGRNIELKSGETGQTLNSGLAMIHNQLLVTINGGKRFVQIADVKSIGHTVFSSRSSEKQPQKHKTREYEGKEEEVLDAALDDGKKV